MTAPSAPNAGQVDGAAVVAALDAILHDAGDFTVTRAVLCERIKAHKARLAPSQRKARGSGAKPAKRPTARKGGR